MRSDSVKSQELEQSALETLLYFWTEKKPLFLAEIDNFLLGQKRAEYSLSDLKNALDHLRRKGIIESKKGLYLPKAAKIFHWLSQADKIKEAHKKIELTARSLFWLSIIGSLEEICICGSVAGRNCSPSSDIDLLILTEKNRVWTTRFWLTIFSWLWGKKKRPGKSRKDRFCLNHYRDSDSLELEKSMRDRYSAKEYFQMIRLLSKNHPCNFLKKNKLWADNFLIHFNFNKPALFETKNTLGDFFFSKRLGDQLENFFKFLQLGKITQSKNKIKKGLDRSRIILENGVIMFHLNPKAPSIERKFYRLKNKFFAKNE